MRPEAEMSSFKIWNKAAKYKQRRTGELRRMKLLRRLLLEEMANFLLLAPGTGLTGTPRS